MPVINLDVLVDANGGPEGADGRVLAWSSRARVLGEDLTLPRAVIILVTGGVLSDSLDLEDLPAGAYWNIRAEVGVLAPFTRTVVFPVGDGPFDFEDLVDVDPTTMEADPEPAWWAVANQMIEDASVTQDGYLTFIRHNDELVGPFYVKGPKGDKGDVGPAGMNWRGEWSDIIDYVVDDAVGYGGSSWFATQDPPVGEIPSDASSYWQAFALHGSQGDPGPSNSLTVGTVTSLPAGTTPTVTLTGASPSQIINFGLTVGNTGATGPKGDAGDLTPSAAGTWNGAQTATSTVPNTTVATLTGDVTLAWNATPGSAISFTRTIAVIQDGTGNHSFLFTGTVPIKWPESAGQPPARQAAGAITVYQIQWMGSGLGWLGFLGGGDFA